MLFDHQLMYSHIQKNIGPITTVFEEVISDDLRINIVHVGSSFFRRYETLITSGMSFRSASIPDGNTESPYTEAIILLPKGWPLTKQDFTNENNYWPLRLLKDIARYPHGNETWLGFGHTIGNGSKEQDMKPYSNNTQLCAAIILPPMLLGEKAFIMQRQDGKEVFFWCVVPLHASELAYKMKEGVDPLLDIFDKKKVKGIIDPQRKAVI